MFKSWQTSAAGITTALALASPQLSALFDGKAESVCDWNVVIAAVGILFGGLMARDNNKKSESVGAE